MRIFAESTRNLSRASRFVNYLFAAIAGLMLRASCLVRVSLASNAIKLAPARLAEQEQIEMDSI